MIRKKVLVFPCGSEIGLEIYAGLKWSTYIDLYGASSSKSNHGRMVFKNYLDGFPFFSDKDFIKKINKFIRKYKIDFIFPANDDVGLILSKNIEKLRCALLYSPFTTAKICRSKSLTYKFFSKLIDVPKIYKINQKSYSFPLFLKPDSREGSKGIQKVMTKEELSFYVKKDPTLLILEYLPGKEYTVDCFTDRKRNLRFVGARVRVRTANGISVDTYTIKDQRFQNIAKVINKNINLRGAWFFQVKERVNDDLVLLEIAPRIAGSMALYRPLGINFPLLTVFDGMGMDIDLLNNKYFIEMDRALINRYIVKLNYNFVYIDLDDTVIFQKKINPQIMMFLAQCINKNIKIILLTKHKEDIKKTLKFYRVKSIFDKIILIGKSQEKTAFISQKNAIFIDDSYGERKRVAEKLKIPVFDTVAIESLLDWRF